MPKTMWKCRKLVFALIILLLCLIETGNAESDICSSLCRCVNESHFVKIHCDFIDNKVSNSYLKYFYDAQISTSTQNLLRNDLSIAKTPTNSFFESYSLRSNYLLTRLYLLIDNLRLNKSQIKIKFRAKLRLIKSR